MPLSPVAGAKAELVELLEATRARTLLLLTPLSEEDATLQHDPLMSPIVWDLGHIAAFEELWLEHHLDRVVEFGEMPGMYNPFEHPRAERGALPLPSLRTSLDRLAQAREQTLTRLARIEIDGGSELLRGGYVYRMVAQHEAQHQETILQTLQLKRGAYAAPRRWEPPAATISTPAAMVRFAGGDVIVGTDDYSAAYDNEKPAHAVLLAPFEIDVSPVANGDYAEFIADGGYRDLRHWSAAGREWLHASGVEAPRHWRRDGSGWRERFMDRERPIDPRRPVCHVCFYEAEAYASWARKRLPTEQEWETAATWHPEGKRAYPWGSEEPDRTRANVDQLAFDTAPVGAHPAARSALGCDAMIGDVWEWTASDFAPYPGFRAWPYREYSEPFFGAEYKVLRGGSWATAPIVARATFRNWDLPVRRQIFAGFRCARDG